MVDISAPLANLLARGDEGIARRDWKFAVDSLQRIIDDASGSLVPRDDASGDREVVYESMRRHATRRVATLPKEGLATYRLLYDGKAKRLFDRAREASDAAGLRAIVDRYLLTRWGDDAADLLASWALDEGRAVEAVRVLEEVRELIPDSDVPERLIVAKLAVAYTLLGDWDRAESVIQSLGQLSSQQSADGLADLTRRLAREPAYMLPPPADVRSWPTLGGTSTRIARMPAVTPDLVDPLPWVFHLPGRAGELWPRALPSDLSDPLILPASYLVADEERLFVRTLRGCAALDIETLSLIWGAPPTSFDPYTGEAALSEDRGLPPQGETLADRVFGDHVAESIAVTNGLVLTIESRRAKAFGDEADSTSEMIQPGIGFPDNRNPGVSATVLVARDAATGEVRWQRGRTFDVADPLGNADFRATPLAVDDSLWVPYVTHGDLLVGVLDPEDGSSIADILLCSLPVRGSARAILRRTEYSLGDALTPAYAHGVVFIPSGHGVLFAADAAEHRLRWANRYRSSRAWHRARLPGGWAGWMSSPPVVTGGLVLLTPTDSDEVLALSAADGYLRWSTRVTGGAYIIAADDRRLWIGGTSVTCLALADGAQLWTLPSPSVPSGRGALAGDVIYMPTIEGLLVVNADSGKKLDGEVLPPSVPPLGNLLCLRSSMFSLEPSSVRRYPDLSRLHPEVKARHERDPGDIGVALQLAWMELLLDEPRRALELLAEIPEAAVRQEQRQLDEISHLRIEALLASAKKQAVDPPEALDLLRQARLVARRPLDRLRSGLALADRLDAMGRYEETVRTLWELGLSSDADCTIPLADDVEGDARHYVARRLRWVESKLTADELGGIRRFVEERIDSAVRVLASVKERQGGGGNLRVSAGERSAAALLRRAADVSPRLGGCQYGRIELAGYRFARRQLEQAELLLLNVVRSSLDPAATITAQMRLAQLYAEPTQRQASLLGRHLDELNRRSATAPAPDMTFSDVSIWPKEPPEPPTHESAVGPSVEPTIEPVDGSDEQPPAPGKTVGDWIAAFRERAAARALDIAEHTAATSPSADGAPDDASEAGEFARAQARGSEGGLPTPHIEPFHLTGDVAWSLRVTTHGRSRALAPFELPEALLAALGRIQTSGPPRQVRFPYDYPACLGDRAVFYAPGEGIYCQDVSSGELLWYTRLDLPNRLSDAVPVLQAPPVGTSHRAVADGQTVVLNGVNGLHAVGLVTGKRLWVRPYEFVGLPTASAHSAAYTRMPDTAMDADDGLVAVTPTSERLALLRMSDGISVWERDLHGERVAHIRLTNKAVVTADAWLQRVHLFDRSDGTLIKQIRFRQPDPESPLLVQLVHTGGIICGPDCSARSDGVAAVDLATGETVWRLALDKPLAQLFRPREGCVGIGLLGGDVRIVDAATGDAILDSRAPRAHSVFDGAIADGTLVAKCLLGQGPFSPPGLTGFDMETGTVLWQRADLAPAMGNTPLQIVGGRIPVIVRAEFLQEGPKKGSRIALIDLRTGEDVEPTVALPFGEGGARFNGDLTAYRGSIIAGTTHGVHAFSTELVGDDVEDGL